MVSLARPRSAAAEPAEAPSRDGGFCVRGVPPRLTLRGGAAATKGAPAKQAKTKAQAAQALGRLEKGAPVEYLSLVKVKGDGKCLFRSLVLGLAAVKGLTLSSSQEEKEADALRTAVAEVMCGAAERREAFPEALIAIKDEFRQIQEYCKRLQSPTFWGGEAELLVLSTLLRQPITVYLSPAKVLGYKPLVTYGQRFEKLKSGAVRPSVKLLYSNGNHYDLLL